MPFGLKRKGFTEIDEYIRQLKKDPKMRAELAKAKVKLWRWMRVRGLKPRSK